ncbi:hypothetical protein AgCh_018827 [Apium graveolens]
MRSGSSSSGSSSLNPPFVFGASGNASGINHDTLVDNIRSMDISDKIRNMNVSDGSNASGSNSGLVMELPDQISKLNIGETGGDVGGGGLKFGGLRDTSGNVLPDMFNKLNIKESVVSDRGDAGFGSKSEAVYNVAFSSPGVKLRPVMNPLSASEGVGNVFNQRDEMRTPYVEFKTPNLKEYLVSGLDRNREPRGVVTKEAKLKKKKRNVRKPNAGHLMRGEEFVSGKPNAGHLMRDEEFVFGEVSSRENCDSSEAYSPMDVSPYQETVAEVNQSRETSVTLDEVIYPDDSCGSSESHPPVSTNAIDEDLADATNRLNINKSDTHYTGFGYEAGTDCCDKGFVAEVPSEESVSGAETESFKSAAEQLEYSSDTFVTAGETEISSCSSLERQDNDGKTQFNFSSSIEDTGSSSFTFAASSSNQAPVSADTRHYKKKHKLKVGGTAHSSFLNDKVPLESSTSPFFPFSGTSSIPSPRQGRKGDESKLFGKGEIKFEPVKDQEVRQVGFSSGTSIAAQEACEKWRLRGNQAYASGDFLKAEECYTKGVNCVSRSETSKSCINALVLCYSNRAATLMCSGRMREALQDCMLAADLDPSFLRVQLRAANCYLALGEADIASVHFIKCLQAGSGAFLDTKHLAEASEGMDKAKKILECMKQSADLLQQGTAVYAEHALARIEEALTISSFSEKLQELKANVLFMLRRYDEVILFCEKTMDSAKINCSVVGRDNRLNNGDDPEVRASCSFRLWRWNFIAKSYFYLGKMDEALDFVKKQEESVLITERNDKSMDSVIPLACTIRDLLRFKVSGNEAFQSGRHAEAIEHYTAALSCSVESRPFAAVCFCNRAAAYQALGQIAYAISDCSVAIALDGSYAKAISRRATLFEMIRDFGQASTDLLRLESLLKRHVEDKVNQSGPSDRMSRLNELKQTQQRLYIMEEKARKDIPLNMYLILGVERSAATSEIKKAYRKAALRHHPDKAGQFLTKSDSGDDNLWKEIADEVHKDTERLFKMIGEAYAVLSDPVKRSRFDQEQYDQEEVVRNSHRKGNMSGTTADVHNYQFDRSGSRRNWEEILRSYGNSQPWGSERSRSNRYS